LKKIEGIGPKIAELFAGAGIADFKALAEADVAQLKGILEEAGSRYKMHDPSTWPAQAKLAHEEKWDELKEMQDGLKGGK
jgi:predicted flap endonuclease-1-like 5' DNA nuclease